MKDNIYQAPGSGVKDNKGREVKSSEVKPKRPVSVWMVLVLASLVMIFSSLGIVITLINITTLNNQSLNWGYIGIFLAIRSMVVSVCGVTLYAIFKRKVVGWYLSLLMPIGLIAFKFSKLLLPEIFPEPLYPAANEAEKDASMAISIIMFFALIYWFWTLFYTNVREYFGLE